MKTFDPELCQCPKCETLLRSRWQGEFVMCECQMSFVDQTEYYSRYGGVVESINSLILKDFKNISGIGYEEDDILEVIADTAPSSCTFTALEIYQSDFGGLGGSSPQDLTRAGRGHKVIAYLEAIRAGY